MLVRVDLLSEGGPGFHFGPRTRRGKGSLWERLRKPSARSAAGRSSAWPGSKQEEPAADSLPVTGGDPLDYDTVSWSSCHVNCGSRCPLKAYVKDGQVVRIDIDSDGDDEFGPGKIYQMRSCVRGRTNRQRIYSPDRIQKPLKRVEGTKRGEGKYDEFVGRLPAPVRRLLHRTDHLGDAAL